MTVPVAADRRSSNSCAKECGLGPDSPVRETVVDGMSATSGGSFLLKSSVILFHALS